MNIYIFRLRAACIHQNLQILLFDLSIFVFEKVLDLSSRGNGWREVGMLPSARYGLRAASLGESTTMEQNNFTRRIQGDPKKCHTRILRTDLF